MNNGLQLECSEEEREVFGKRLKVAISSFTLDFLPHMREEEEVRLFRGNLSQSSRYHRAKFSLP